MASSAFASAVSPQRSIAAINITPLVDVMLVLLVIFMIAAPLLSRAIPLTLPQTGPERIPPTPAEPVDLRVDAAGEVFWNGDVVALSVLPARMRDAVAGDPAQAPALQIDASGDADYAVIVKILAAAHDAGLDKIGFVRR